MGRLPGAMVACSLLLWAPGASAADTDTGARLAQDCAACHLPEGSAAIPAINGRPEAELIAALEDYREGRRGDALMGVIARGLDEAELAAVAAYLAAAQ